MKSDDSKCFNGAVNTYSQQIFTWCCFLEIIADFEHLYNFKQAKPWKFALTYGQTDRKEMAPALIQATHTKKADFHYSLFFFFS